MSLLFDADGDQIQLPSITPAGGTGAVTIALWAYLSDDTTRQNWWSGPSDHQIMFRGDRATDDFECFREGATYGEAGANGANFAVYTGPGKYYALVFRADTGSPATVWLGDETTTPAAPSAYAFQNTLVTPATTAGTTLVGANVVTTRWVRNRIGAYA